MKTEHPRTASDTEIEQAAEVILGAEYPIALTGAGMSVESGIPPFRGPGGLWTKYGEPPMNQFQRFMTDPKKAWEERLSTRNDEFYNPCPRPANRAILRWRSWRSWGYFASSSPRTLTISIVRLGRSPGRDHGNWKLIRCLIAGCAAASKSI